MTSVDRHLGPGGARIRRARLDDAVEMARLSAELGYPMEAQEMHARLSRLSTDSRHVVYVAEHAGDRLLGWLHAEHRFSLEGGSRVEVMGLVIDRAARRASLGTALMAGAEDWASEQGASTVTVRSNAARDASHAFYEARGYVRTKTQHVYEKTLPPSGESHED